MRRNGIGFGKAFGFAGYLRRQDFKRGFELSSRSLFEVLHKNVFQWFGGIDCQCGPRHVMNVTHTVGTRG
jgi:hypothetical protein